MGVEIERKFRVRNLEWRKSVVDSQHLTQGYLTGESSGEAEVRIRCFRSHAFITIKGKGSLTRVEFEYEIPYNDAQKLLVEFCKPHLVEKIWHTVRHNGLSWSIDEFLGVHSGLTLAEVELDDVHQVVDLPNWVGEDVTEEPTYRNANLARNPQAWRAIEVTS